jgi:protein-S-isoprenylcysteine O-methyltransferase Ste14
MPDTAAKTVPDRIPIKRWARLRLWAGYVYIVLAVCFSHPYMLSAEIGTILAILGVAVRFQAASELVKDTSLCSSGLYSGSRHPLYFGSALIGLGIAVITGSIWFLLGYFAILAPLYMKIMTLEEKYLTELFPEAYPGYIQTVPKFFPRPGPFFISLGKKPDWEKLRKSGELISAFLIFVVIILILAFNKTWLSAV